MTEVVLDASALLASLRDEPGKEQVDAAVEGAWLSAVNLAEVVQRLVDLGASDDLIHGIVRNLPCRIEPLDGTCAIDAGLLRRTTRSQGLSLGDRACLALAMRENLPVLTADRAWADLDLGIEVVLIR